MTSAVAAHIVRELSEELLGAGRGLSPRCPTPSTPARPLDTALADARRKERCGCNGSAWAWGPADPRRRTCSPSRLRRRVFDAVFAGMVSANGGKAASSTARPAGAAVGSRSARESGALTAAEPMAAAEPRSCDRLEKPRHNARRERRSWANRRPRRQREGARRGGAASPRRHGQRHDRAAEVEPGTDWGPTTRAWPSARPVRARRRQADQDVARRRSGSTPGGTRRGGPGS